MYLNNPPNPSKVPIQTDLQNMNKFINSITFLQNEINQKVLLRQQQFHHAKSTTSTRINSLNTQFLQFRQVFNVFSSQCKHQWITVYKELLLIINNIVELYQIKLEKLQAKIEQQQQIIQKFNKKGGNQNQRGKLVTQGYEGENQYQCQNILESLQQSILQNNQKKVKISDVIASYQSSVLSSQTNKDEIYEDINIDLQNLPETTKHHESIFESNPKFFKSNKSQTLKHTLDQLSLTQTFKTYNSKSDAKLLNNSIEQKENHPSFISSRKLSEFQQTKRSSSKTGRSRVREPNEASSVSKLSQLRKYLYNRIKM